MVPPNTTIPSHTSHGHPGHLGQVVLCPGCALALPTARMGRVLTCLSAWGLCQINLVQIPMWLQASCLTLAR